MRSAPLVALVVLLAGCIGAPAAPPSSADGGGAGADSAVLGAIGNSLMLGYNADDEHIESAPEIAWATGDAPWSFRRRAGIAETENVAQPGAGTDEYLAQVAKLERATLVLVMMLDSAMCGPPSLDGDAAFEAELREGTRALLERGMTPMLLTPPDIVSVAQAARAKPPANDFVLTYGFGQECGLEPGVAERQAAMNALIARVAEEEGALHDHGAIAGIRWSPEMISDVDGLHPSPAGLEAIADAVWARHSA